MPHLIVCMPPPLPVTVMSEADVGTWTRRTISPWVPWLLAAGFGPIPWGSLLGGSVYKACHHFMPANGTPNCFMPWHNYLCMRITLTHAHVYTNINTIMGNIYIVSYSAVTIRSRMKLTPRNLIPEFMLHPMLLNWVVVWVTMIAQRWRATSLISLAHHWCHLVMQQ